MDSFPGEYEYHPHNLLFDDQAWGDPTHIRSFSRHVWKPGWQRQSQPTTKVTVKFFEGDSLDCMFYVSFIDNDITRSDQNSEPYLLTVED